MSSPVILKHGDYTGLAENYAKFRPGYAPQLVTAILGFVGRDAANIDGADIGAGTGIWTRMLAARSLRSIIAIEPNDEMRERGLETSRGTPIVWRKGSAEATGLPDASVDLVSMASSFHWADFDKACDEFHRILRRGGVRCAVEPAPHRDQSTACGDRKRDYTPETRFPSRLLGTFGFNRTSDRKVIFQGWI